MQHLPFRRHRARHDPSGRKVNTSPWTKGPAACTRKPGDPVSETTPEPNPMPNPQGRQTFP
uniref:Uncharacterized protein n=1 Tax=uncultured bacterium A1Q1_fos_1050 TaxID=1256538 RepID=L7VU50_9BACT|nr:hypothetical protein [uncultured bacterium A1Q1_fos_1050]